MSEPSPPRTRESFEEALRASEKNFQEVTEKSLQGISIYQDLRLVYANPAMAAIHGYSAEELCAMSLAELAELVHPDDRPIIGERTRRRLAGEPVDPCVEIRIVRPDGAVRWLQSFNNPIEYNGRPAVLTTSIDVTDLRNALDRVHQSRKTEAIGLLAGGVAHDFNNVLSIVMSYAELMTHRLPPADPLREELGEICAATERAAALTRQLLAFSRRQVLAPRVIDIQQVVGGMAKMLRRLVGEHIELELEPSPSTCRVHADPGQIEQVILNLVVNARDAMPGGGRVTIETRPVEIDEPSTGPAAGLAPGSYVLVAVADTGVGIDAATRERIFEPFFTTKEEGRGTGLGLASVSGIVSQSGGHVSVTSEPGLGSTFHVYLPRVHRRVDAPAVPAPPPEGLHGTETILVVEDDDAMRALMRTILRQHGYRVLDAPNGAEAYFVAERFGGPIHLLVTDVVMPHMGGRELARRLLATRPELAVLYVSGYTRDANLDGGLDAHASFLQKPLTPTSLTRKVREALGGPAPVAAAAPYAIT